MAKVECLLEIFSQEQLITSNGTKAYFKMGRDTIG